MDRLNGVGQRCRRETQRALDTIKEKQNGEFNPEKGTIVTSGKKAKWIYWAVTAPFVVTMLIASLMLLAGVASNVEGITRLGYPVYICKILGTAKLLGGSAILYGRFRTFKEWAYAGYTFNLLGAAASHAFSGDSFGKVITPVIILGFVLASYRLWKNALDVKAG